MEINKYFDITGAVANENMKEGRLVKLVAHTFSYNYGSREDLPGAELPDTSAEAAQAHFIIAFAVDNSTPPIYQSYPTIPNTSLRYGFDGASNVPFAATVHLTAPSMKEGLTIPSGALALAFGPGVFTVPSGDWIYNASIVPGAWLISGDTASDGAGEAGKPKYSATETKLETIRVDSDQNLTFRINS